MRERSELSRMKRGDEVKYSSVKRRSRVKQRVGIYSGTFDPIHAGHIAFALQAVKAARLQAVYFVPERVPRGKRQVTHFAHRVAMIRRATRPYEHLDVLELEDKTFSIARTLPRLQQTFPSCDLVYICGSDVVKHMPQWPYIESLMQQTELCVGRRADEAWRSTREVLQSLPLAPRKVTYVESPAPAVSSSQIRVALRKKHGVRGLLASVKVYANREWLYL
ncbi:adenylyltransferase/cytidyltransferase family protein [Candidatus Saccharibacteria bacterium]|nr:adenylyltransferase/cytidyltransferase family protein [Candidatus Saccharibacteria bacterium]